MIVFPKTYRALTKNEFVIDNYKLVPIRYEDRMLIMKWRNEQIYHLRQTKPLTEADQENYFNNIVSRLFEQEKPEQILFSYLENDVCIGYGGLVHINWIDKNAEISFIINTELERNFFKKHWSIYLDLLEQVTFNELKLHKLYTYAFDLRPHLYEVTETKGYEKEAVLKEHCFFNGEYKNVIIHSKLNRQISIRLAKTDDLNITYEWANDELTRKNSFSSESVLFENHKTWWSSKMNDDKAVYYICEAGNVSAGIVRFDKDKESENFIIGVTVAPTHRRKGLADKFLKLACTEFFKTHNNFVDAYIKHENTASIKSFEKAGFTFVGNVPVRGVKSLKYQLKKNEQR